jgi:NAD(P)-dependent dehydrogenase (short-subunit alcohol dehydrogenase family)
MNIVVNGGSKGIGREIVLQMSGDINNQILVTGRNTENLKELVSDCRNGNVTFLSFDLSVIDKELRAIKNQIYSLFSKIDILINNAGLLVVKDFLKISNQEARAMMETNFFGPATFIRLLAPLMPAGSHVVNISSMGGFQGSSKYKGLAYYSASKAALACLTECLATEFSDAGISVNCLSLGSVQTEMFESAFRGIKAPVNPGEMAQFIAYFAVNGNKYFNGKILPVAMRDP